MNSLMIGLVIGGVCGWSARTAYQRGLWRMSVRIRRAMRGGNTRRRRR